MSELPGDLERLATLRREAERIVRHLFPAEPGEMVPVVADVFSDESSFILEAEVPGVRPEDLAVFGVGEAVLVEGRKESAAPAGVAAPSFERAERAFGAFRRLFELPGPADVSRARVTLKDGLLTIVVPRVADRRGRKRPLLVQVENG